MADGEVTTAQGEPRNASRNEPGHTRPARRFSGLSLSIAVAVVGLSVTVIVFLAMRESESTRAHQRFERPARAALRELQRNLEWEVMLLSTLASVFDPTSPNPVEFERFVAMNEKYTPDLLAVEWLQRVPSLEREAFERTALPDGSGHYSIFELDGAGDPLPAVRRPDHFPITLCASRLGADAIRSSYGLDFAAFPERLRAMERANGSGELTAVGPIDTAPAFKLPPTEREPLRALFFFQPIYAGGSVPPEAERDVKLAGYAVALFLVHDLFRSVLEDIDLSAMQLRVFVGDPSSDASSMRLAYRSGDQPSQASLLTLDDLRGVPHYVDDQWTLAGLEWCATAVPTDETLFVAVTNKSSLALLVGLLGTAAATLLLHRLFHAQRRLARETRQFWRLSAEMLCVTDPEGVLRRVNPAWKTLLGLDVDQLPGRSFLELVHEGDQEATRSVLTRLRSGASTLQFELRMRAADGRWRWIQWSAAPDEDHRTIHAVARDVTEQRATFEELERRATIDPLTHVLTRRALFDRLGIEIHRAKRYGSPLSIAVLDLDHFKQVNDQHGHGTGDELLQRLGQLLRKALRESDLAGRFGGDEFVIVMPQTDLDAARKGAARVLRALHDHGTVTTPAGAQVPLRASIGVATLAPEIEDATALVARADEALYRAKGRGRAQIA